MLLLRRHFKIVGTNLVVPGAGARTATPPIAAMRWETRGAPAKKLAIKAAKLQETLVHNGPGGLLPPPSAGPDQRAVDRQYNVRAPAAGVLRAA